jgi:hypothetical protein
VSGVGPPGRLRLIWLLLALRLRLSARRGSRNAAIGGSLFALLSLVAVGALGWGGYRLTVLLSQAQAASTWLHFMLALLTFLLALFWVIWPVVAAQINEAGELGRYLLFPIAPRRFHLAQTVTALVEPTSLLFTAPLIGVIAALGQAAALPVSLAWLPLLCFVLMNICCGRMFQLLLLNVMASRRSAEALSLALLLSLGLSFFVPTVDASWLFARLGSFGGSEADLALLVRTTATLTITPPGWLARSLIALAEGERLTALLYAAMMIALAAASWLVGLWLLRRYYLGEKGKSRSPRLSPPRRRRLRICRSLFVAMVQRELGSLLNNPKVRLLFAVPLFLVIILKVVGASQLLAYLWHDAWAAKLLTILAGYTLSVLAGQFFANSFAYDGPALRQILLSPVPLTRWVLARNLAQLVLATSQFAALVALVVFGLPGAHSTGLLLPIAAFGLGLPTTLAVGNLLSARYPRRFDFRLARRDRPVGISLIWIIAALGACAGLLLLADQLHSGVVAALPLLGVLVYAALLPIGARWIDRHHELLLHEIARQARD